MTDTQTDLLSLSPDALEHLLTTWGQPRYRADQVLRGIYHHYVRSLDDIRNLPQSLHQRLAVEATMATLTPIDTRQADEGDTEKVLFQAVDGHLLEAVLMRYARRHTVCVSTQIGCAVGCGFCATGAAGLVRDLSAGEIVAQVLHFARHLAAEGIALTNVVFMGMGEPFLNSDAFFAALGNLIHPRGLGMGARRFTVSTAGVVPGIERLAREAPEVGLAVSLHAADDALRDKLVPMNRRYPLGDIMRAIRTYVNTTHRRPTFEYALLASVNDTDAHAHALAMLLQGLLCHVNIVPLNATPGCAYQPPSYARVERFAAILQEAHIETTVRLSRGAQIGAGCGQLRGERTQQRKEQE